MKKLTTLVLWLFIALYSTADEGMWLPMYLQQQGIIKIMQKKGCKLTASQIYDENAPSLKDAVVLFGNGCTGEFISSQGLILTNYHCGFYYIQQHSSVEHDYLSNGYWAYSKDQELPNPGLTIKILIHTQDVTEQVLKNITQKTNEAKRKIYIKQNIKKLINQTYKKYNQKYYYCEIKPFYNGNQYIMMIYEIFKDVRLVGAPPSTIGKFGGDTDNWMWPRHTGDFSLFRVYVDKNNKPSEYSPDNVPYKPKKFFKISLNGIKKDQFTMVYGFPGYTSEYIPSYAVKLIQNVYNPLKINIRDKKLNIINNAIKQNKKIAIMYAAKQASLSNAWKKWKGENLGLTRLKIIKKKQLYEKKLQQKILNNPKLAKYKNLLNDLKLKYQQQKNYQIGYYAFIECFYYSDIYKIFKFFEQNAEDLKQLKNQGKIDNLYKDYIPNIEKELFAVSLEYFYNNAPQNFIPKKLFDKIKNFDNNPKKYAYHIFNSSKITTLEKAKNVKLKDLNNDELFTIIKDIKNQFVKVYYSNQAENINNQLDSLNRLYMNLQMQLDSSKILYPDANHTLRLSFGNVKGYTPRDAIKYKYYTTIDGIIEKTFLNIYDYKIPKKLKKLYEKKDFGNYIDQTDSTLHIAFIATNHTTGGNSGSPVIDENGNLIGVNFDRVWEGTMSDLAFDNENCRNISLDIRYVIFIIDKYANAKNILNELKFAK